MPSKPWLHSGGVLLAALLGAVEADTGGAVGLQTGGWHGKDGNWSHIVVRTASDGQLHNVLPNTASAESWLFAANASRTETWPSAPILPRLSVASTSASANGLDAVDVFDLMGGSSQATRFNHTVVTSVDHTQVAEELLGIASQPGRSDDAGSVTDQLTASGLPSRSYGYTAGAYYAGENGTPASLTLGGIDESRYEAHHQVFPIDSATGVPTVRIRGITASLTGQAPPWWASPATAALVTSSDNVTAVIDTSTPFLVLPEQLCRAFATVLNLNWDNELSVYTFASEDQVAWFKTQRSLNFTFMLDSTVPSASDSAVNITLSSSAFVQRLAHGNETATRPVSYFPIKRAADGHSASIGRAFMQEAYLIANYDTQSFSLHQARLPAKIADPVIANVYTGSGNDGGLSRGAIAGIVIGSIFGTFLMLGIAASCFRCLRRRFRKDQLVEKRASDAENGLVPRIKQWLAPKPRVDTDTLDTLTEKNSEPEGTHDRRLSVSSATPSTVLSTTVASAASASQTTISSSFISPAMDVHKRQAVDAIMLEFRSILAFGPAVGLRIRAGGRESPSNSSVTLTSSKRSSGSSDVGSKRSRDDVEEENGSKGNGPKRARQSPDHVNDGEGRLFACPYYQRNPEKHQKLRSCAGPGWKTVHRVKEHLHRNHALPLHCLRCGKIMKSEVDLGMHQRQADICAIQHFELPEGFNKEQEEKLRKRRRYESEEEKWSDMYLILFPDEDGDLIPLPYYEDANTADAEQKREDDIRRYERYQRRELLRVVRRNLEDTVSGLAGPLEEQLRTQLVGIIRKSQLEVFKSYKTDRNGHDDGEDEGPDQPPAANNNTSEIIWQSDEQPDSDQCMYPPDTAACPPGDMFDASAFSSLLSRVESSMAHLNKFSWDEMQGPAFAQHQGQMQYLQPPPENEYHQMPAQPALSATYQAFSELPYSSDFVNVDEYVQWPEGCK